MTPEVMDDMTLLDIRLPMFGEELRRWRAVRRMSQEDLSGLSEVSARHLSCLERGIARPSEKMVLRLSEALSLPLREQNCMLQAAGYAPRWRDGGECIPDALQPVVEQILTGCPDPAYVLNGHYRVLGWNSAGLGVLNIIKPGIRQGDDLAEAFFGDGPHRTTITNYAEAAGFFLARLRAEAAEQGLSSPLWKTIDRAKADHGISKDSISAGTELPIMPIEVLIGDETLRLLTVLLTFGSPQDAMVEQLTIEQLLPADDATRLAVRRMFGNG
jgi:transcriptional regulator with XRE-family HTH domain